MTVNILTAEKIVAVAAAEGIEIETFCTEKGNSYIVMSGGEFNLKGHTSEYIVVAALGKNEYKVVLTDSENVVERYVYKFSQSLMYI